MRRAALCGAALLAVALSAGCASGSSDLSKKGQKALEPYIIQLRSAAAGKDATAVRQAVRRLEAEVHSQHDKGRISAGRAADIDDAATQLLHDFLAAVKPPPSPSATSTSPTPSSQTPTMESPSESPTETTTVTPRQTRTVTISPPQLHPGSSSSSTASSPSSGG